MGADSGVFIGYLQSTLSAVVQYDGLLSLGEEVNVGVQYTDQYDPSDISTGSAVLDPNGVVFYDNYPIAQGKDGNDFTAKSAGTTYYAASYTVNNRVELH